MRHGKDCAILTMLRGQKKHVSFHTPGHKRAGCDITELSYSDSLSAPNGVIARAEADCARILGADGTFLLTDGSTSGVYAMLFAAKRLGCRSVACSVYSHVSVKNGCKLAGLAAVEIDAGAREGIPLQPDIERIGRALAEADALLITSPDYYGNFPPLAEAAALCKAANKPLLIDGAHGAHLHFLPEYAGNYADIWVDGLHKSLPALTQGAAVSAKTRAFSEALAASVRMFRTTSPSYPVLASCEYAIKYPRNEKIERAAQAFKREHGAIANADWSKLLFAFGEYAQAAQDYLEAHGVYPEFQDGNYLMFYLSPCTSLRELKKLARLLKRLPRGTVKEEERRGETAAQTELIPLELSEGRICAAECGLFPPCIPLLTKGSVITKSKLVRLSRAAHTFGLVCGKIEVYTDTL